MGHTVVHKASTGAVESVLDRLRAGGVDAVAVDDPNWIALFVSFGTYRIRIAVPDEEADEARRVLAEWDREARPALKELSRQLYRQFLVAALVAGLIALGLVLAGLVWQAPLVFVITWVTLVALFGVVQRRGGGDDGTGGGEDGGA